MANRANLVNLDAMIIREDFAVKSSQTPAHYDKQDKISVRDFAADGLLGSLLRKPDFQRETNHWTPEQVVSLLECYVDGDLIPSVILWQSETATFVIDGAIALACFALGLKTTMATDTFPSHTSAPSYQRNRSE